MAFFVAGKHALITGAGSGINLAFARLLLQRGCSVTIGDIGLQPGAEELLRQYPHTAGSNSKKPAAIFHKTDVSSWPQLSSLWARATSAFPTVDIVCPGAGIFEPSWSSFWEPPVTATNPNSPSRDRADAAPGTYATIDVCLTHPIRLSQLALGYWLAEQNKGKAAAAAAGGTRGVLLHVSSIAGHSTSIGTPLYYASKHGLHAFVRSLGSLRDTVGVRVGAVAPCGVKTPMWTEDPEKIAMQREGDDMAEPEEMAEAMLRLCEEEALGDGTILEVTKGATRVVPEYHAAPPSGRGLALKGYIEMQDSLVERLKAGDFKA